jgi:hypothetical protein
VQSKSCIRPRVIDGMAADDVSAIVNLNIVCRLSLVTDVVNLTLQCSHVSHVTPCEPKVEMVQ